MQGEFRFRLLSELDTNYSVRCVSSPTNVMLGNYAHLLNEEAVLKVIGDVKQSIGGRDIGKAYDDSGKLRSVAAFPDDGKDGFVSFDDTVQTVCMVVPAGETRQCNSKHYYGKSSRCRESD